MRILIDARCVREDCTGVGGYTEAMVRALGQVAHGDEVVALSLNPSFWQPAPVGVRLEKVDADYEIHPRGEFFEHVSLPRLMRRMDADVLWGPAFLVPWVPTRAPKIATIHDMTVFSHARCYPARFAAYMRFVIRRAAASASAIVCDSPEVAELVRALPGAGGKPVEVIPCAADAGFFPGEEPDNLPDGVRRPYVLSIGSGDPRKNTEFAVRVTGLLRTEHGLPRRHVVIGKPAGDGGEVIRLPRQPRESLAALYRHADLFLFPSVYEGFGMPVLEAMASGCPVAAAASGAIPWVAGDAALLFDLAAGESVAATAIAGLLRSPADLQALRDAGIRRAAGFSWESSAVQLLHLFRRLAKGEGHAT